MPPLAPRKESQTETQAGGDTLAICLFDLDRIAPLIRESMGLSKLLDTSHANLIRVDKDRVDETAIIFTCSLLQAALVCDIIRNHDRQAGDFPTRVYLRRVGAWERLTRDAVLTIVNKDGRAELNPQIFTVQKPKVSGTVTTPPVKVFGRRKQ